MYSDADLIGYLLGALEPDSHTAIRRALRNDRGLRARLEHLQQTLAPLDESRHEFEPPSGLVARTLASVESARRRPREVPADWTASRSLRPIDLVLAVSACLMLVTLAVPALLNTREHSRIMSCQWNLKEVGERLTSYAQTRPDRSYPPIRVSDELAFAGAAAVFLRDAHLLEPKSEFLICPGSQWTQDRWLGIPSRQELIEAGPERLPEMQRQAGGSYGWYLGVVVDRRYRPPRNRGRSSFALLSDAPPLQSPSLTSFNHGRQGYNVLCDDMHVEFMRVERMATAPDNPLRNHLGQVAPGIGPNDSVVAPSEVPPRPFETGFWTPWWFFSQ